SVAHQELTRIKTKLNRKFLKEGKDVIRETFTLCLKLRNRISKTMRRSNLVTLEVSFKLVAMIPYHSDSDAILEHGHHESNSIDGIDSPIEVITREDKGSTLWPNTIRVAKLNKHGAKLSIGTMDVPKY